MLKPTPQLTTPDVKGESDLALRRLFDEEESSVLRYAYSLVGRREVAEEIVQDVFLQLHSRWEEVDSPRGWLFRTVRNRAFNFIRDHRREVLKADASDQPSESDDAPDALMQRMELLAALRTLLSELDESDRQLVKLKYFENLKYRDISERTGLSISNVGYRLHHILKKLASKLRPLGIDDNE
jgi:RNA polymerase sigma-70 factor (ECF subfamily)